jgi:hypothetical protein
MNTETHTPITPATPQEAPPPAPPEAHQKTDGVGQGESLFMAGHVIYSYTRAQAIADGVLVDVTEVAAEAGFKVPVAITRSVWTDCVEWPAEIQAHKAILQEEGARLWDVVWMAFLACRAPGNGARRVFELHRVPRDGKRARCVSLVVCIGPGDDPGPVITIMQPDED